MDVDRDIIPPDNPAVLDSFLGLRSWWLPGIDNGLMR